MHGNHFNRKAPREAVPAPAHVKDYDVHIYFKDGEPSAETAQALASKIQALFPDAVKSVDRNGAVGPHLAPNYGVNITAESFGKVVSWLQLNSNSLSILVHPHTGDEVKDHLNSCLWLGKQLKLNPAYFAKFKAANKNKPSL